MSTHPLTETITEYLDAAFSFRDRPEARAVWLRLISGLLRGEPMAASDLTGTRLSREEVADILHSWPATQWRSGAVSGSLLTLEPTRHRVVTPRHAELFTWCVFDAFLIAQLDIGPMLLTTDCPESGEVYLLELDRHVGRGPEGIEISVPTRFDPNIDLRQAFCCRSNASRRSADRVPEMADPATTPDVAWLTPSEMTRLARDVARGLRIVAAHPRTVAPPTSRCATLRPCPTSDSSPRHPVRG